MPKTFDDFRKSMAEWMSVPTAHTARTISSLTLRTNKSQSAKRPSVVQLPKLPYTKAERAKKRIHGFTLEDPKSL